MKIADKEHWKSDVMISDVFERHKSINLSILPSQFTTVIELSIILVFQIYQRAGIF